MKLYSRDGAYCGIFRRGVHHKVQASQICRNEAPCLGSQDNHLSLANGELIRLKYNVTRVVAVVSFNEALGFLELLSDAHSVPFHTDGRTSYVAGLATSFGRIAPPASCRMITPACEVLAELLWRGRDDPPIADIPMVTI